MKKVSTNPLNTLTKEELNEFKKAIDKNFFFIEIEGKIIEDYRTRWFEMHSQCTKYAYWNNIKITNSYPLMEDKTNNDIVKTMIKEELQKR